MFFSDTSDDVERVSEAVSSEDYDWDEDNIIGVSFLNDGFCTEWDDDEVCILYLHHYYNCTFFNISLL